jgi:hypothetical protein
MELLRHPPWYPQQTKIAAPSPWQACDIIRMVALVQRQLQLSRRWGHPGTRKEGCRLRSTLEAPLFTCIAARKAGGDCEHRGSPFQGGPGHSPCLLLHIVHLMPGLKRFLVLVTRRRSQNPDTPRSASRSTSTGAIRRFSLCITQEKQWVYSR